ncbi:hypothetical protein D9757_003829 [Collybiopsis confluens]|uniref:Mitochondrial carrier n=1 Tax=Collybiopsis confluens TaxID=2823264 RepID=A0A8H5HVC2_9AGAR|nr:hypothetical protein D9757_003829 [Collybiopsis confluens]
MHSDGASRSSSKNETQSPNSASEDAVITVKAAVQDIAFGSIAGMVSEVFEYPFDLAKVRLQAQLLSPAGSDGQPRFKGPMDTLMQTRRLEGFKGLYRGLPVPLIGSMAETAAVFVAYSSLKNVIRRYYDSSDELTIPQLTFAAAGAGAAASFIITPIELVKCKLQVQMMNTTTPARVPPIHSPIAPKLLPKDPISSSIYPHPSASRPTLKPATPHSGTSPLPGPLTIVRNVLASNGVGGLWLGHTGTVLRETGGTAVWFAVKEWIARVLKDRRLNDTQFDTQAKSSIPLLPWESAFSGAVAGAVCVAALYPADTVKSAMQTEEELREMRTYQRRALSAAKEWATSSSSALSLSSSTSSPTLSTSSTASKPLPKLLSTAAATTTKSMALETSKKVIETAATNAGSMSFLQTFLQIYRTHGAKGLYSGCGMSMARAVPSSGIVFVVYDGLTAWFS